MRTLAIILFCVLLMMSCDQQTAYRDNATCRIDLTKVDSPSFYDYFSKIEITPLETSGESLIKYITERTYHNGKLYVLDEVQKKIFVFDEKGKFIYKIDKRGNGPGEYSDLSSFRFNSFTGDLELLSPMGGILRYDNLGKNFKGRIPLPLTVSAAHQFIALDEDIYLFLCEARDGHKMVVYDTNQNKITSEMYDLPKFVLFKTFYHHTHSPFYICGGKIHFVQSYNGDVFTLENNSLVPKYRWDFGELNFDISELEDNSLEYFAEYSRTVGAKYANTFVSYSENSRYYMTQFSYDNKLWSLIFDKQNKKHVVFNTFKEGHRCTPTIVDESGVYFVAMPQLVDIILNAQELDNDNRKIYDSLKNDDNPVVIKYVFK